MSAPPSSPASASRETAVVLANGLFRDTHAKTAHALVRGPSRYRVLAVIDPTTAGLDAGEALDGRPRDIPILTSLAEAEHTLAAKPQNCVIGVATPGGVLPDELRGELETAARAGMNLVNGLHNLLEDDPILASLSATHGGRLIDIRRPKPAAELRFWTGEVLELDTPIVPILGVDCAAGKRTTSWLLRAALGRLGLRAEVIYTGQTGWLQGGEHGFILDATLNDFVCGELEGAILDCVASKQPDVVLLEGQAALRNPSGPCGSELVVTTGAAGVVLQHVPGRRHYIDSPRVAVEIGAVEEEIEIVRLLGSEVWAVTLHEEGLGFEDDAQAEDFRVQVEHRLGLPVALPLRDDAHRTAAILARRLGRA